MATDRPPKVIVMPDGVVVVKIGRREFVAILDGVSLLTFDAAHPDDYLETRIC
jgi:hypothetical protein